MIRIAGLTEFDQYRLVGLPFYNDEQKRRFGEDFNKALLFDS